MTGVGEVGFADALYGYLLPSTGTMVWRFDQDTFKEVTSFDLSAASASCQNFAGGFSASDIHI